MARRAGDTQYLIEIFTLAKRLLFALVVIVQCNTGTTLGREACLLSPRRTEDPRFVTLVMCMPFKFLRAHDGV